jgi:L-seryl-tRNA(Ser) seleniumtransferase
MSDRRALLRRLPAIDRLLASPPLAQLEQTLPHVLIREAAQKVVDALRQQVLDERAPLPELAFDAVVQRIAAGAAALARPSLRRVVNVTGTLLHTNLGRAPLCAEALQAITEVARGYSNLEYDLAAGQRGKRFTHVE